MSSRMRAILKFPSRGKELFALRKSLKMQKNALCTVERDPDNISGEFTIKKVILGECLLRISRNDRCSFNAQHDELEC